MFEKIIQQRNRAKDDCKHRLVDFADRTLAFNKKESSKRYRKYQCPWCGSGTGKHQTGNLTIYMDAPTYCKCLVCDEGGDIYDLVGKVYGLNLETQFGEIVQRVFDEFNVDVPKLGDASSKEYVPTLVQKAETPPENLKLDEYIVQLAREDIIEAEKHLEECDYLTKRGIPVSVQRRFHCGYLKAWVHPKIRASVQDDYSQIADYLKSERVIIPDGDPENLHSYTARAIHKEDEANGRKAMKTANPQVFNANVLKSEESQVVFLVEGAIDSMSIETVGFKSLAIGSTAYVDKFFANYTVNPSTTIVVALDNDSAGAKATRKIVETCRLKHIICMVADMDIYGSYKDANELLQSGRELLKTNLAKMVEKARNIDKDEYIKECIKMEEIKNNVRPEAIKLVGVEVKENKFPEVTYENIDSDDILNYFGQLSTEAEVNEYYKYLLAKAREFRRVSTCKPLFDDCKKQMIAYLRNWYANQKANGNVAEDDLPNWVMVEKGRYLINEPMYCQYKMAQRDMRTINGEVYTIDGKVEENGLRREILMDVSKYVRNNLDRVTSGLMNVLKCYSYSPAPDPDTKKIHLLNGTIDLQRHTFLPQKEWCLNRLNVSFKQERKSPVKWLNFLKQLFKSQDDIDTLQEYMGYGLIPNTDAQKMLFIIGNGGEGKSVIGNVYRQILGGSNTYSSHIHLLQDRPCQLANCVNKLVNIDDDTEFKALKDTGTLKGLVSGGSLTVEKKYQAPQDVTLYTRLMCFSNASLQALYDRSDGFYRRQLIIRTKPKDKNRVDNPNLLNELVAEELSDIFMWCLDGLYRLLANKYQFTVSEDSQRLLEDTKREGFNFIEYLEDDSEVIYDENQATTSADLYDSYMHWCKRNCKEAIKKNTVLKWFKDHATDYKVKDDCNILDRYSGKRCRGFKGIKVPNYSCPPYSYCA